MLTVSKRFQQFQIVRILAVLSLGHCAFGQTPSLSLASGSAVQGSSVSLNLSLSGATNAPASLQWTLSYPTAAIASLSTTAGSALTAAGDTLSCNSGSGT